MKINQVTLVYEGKKLTVRDSAYLLRNERIQHLPFIMTAENLRSTGGDSALKVLFIHFPLIKNFFETKKF